jgi:hypothetical protein
MERVGIDPDEDTGNELGFVVVNSRVGRRVPPLDREDQTGNTVRNPSGGDGMRYTGHTGRA